MTHGQPCVKVHVFTRHMGSHVSTWMSFELCIMEGGSQLVHRRREKKGKEEKGRK